MAMRAKFVSSEDSSERNIAVLGRGVECCGCCVFTCLVLDLWIVYFLCDGEGDTESG